MIIYEYFCALLEQNRLKWKILKNKILGTYNIHAYRAILAVIMWVIKNIVRQLGHGI